ncbi:MAG TPA: WYL domain-containing protein [Candidatus Babeliaceae bacterium]|nr:WYL domain-containing protein [Candidatus Babeliaceae bacterium]
MPVNKAARLRFEIIDECLRNTKKKWSKTELLKYLNRRLELQCGKGFEISISQLRYDLQNMQFDYHAPIEMYKSGRSYYYRYEDINFSIKNIPVNEDEIIMLNTAVQVLRQVKGFAIAEEVEDIVRKLASKYDLDMPDAKDIIIFENASNTSGQENLEDLYQAIIQKNVLKFFYSAPNSKSYKVYNIHPYLLKEYGKVWHIVGYCQETQKIDVFALDRMKEIKISKLPYIQDMFFEVESYFKHIIGITKPDNKIQKINFLFSADKAPHILANPIHHSQQVIKQYADGGLEISLDVIVNTELLELILSYGNNVKLLSPTHLILKISSIMKESLQYYDI